MKVTMDEKKVFMIGTLYILLSAIVLNISVRVIANNTKTKEDGISKRYQQLNQNKWRYTLFFLLAGEIIWISLSLLIMVTRINMPEPTSKIITSGIHVPFVFLVDGLIIKTLQKLILRELEVTENDAYQSIFTITFFMNIVLFGFNWEIALFIMAIMIGKYIWLDSTFKELSDYISRIGNACKYLTKWDNKINIVPNALEDAVLEILYFNKDEKEIISDTISFSMSLAMIIFLMVCFGLYPLCFKLLPLIIKKYL